MSFFIPYFIAWYRFKNVWMISLLTQSFLYQLPQMRFTSVWHRKRNYENHSPFWQFLLVFTLFWVTSYTQSIHFIFQTRNEILNLLCVLVFAKLDDQVFDNIVFLDFAPPLGLKQFNYLLDALFWEVLLQKHTNDISRSVDSMGAMNTD